MIKKKKILANINSLKAGHANPFWGLQIEYNCTVRNM